MARVLLTLLAVVGFTTLTAGICPRSLSTNFAATHHHHKAGTGNGQTQDKPALDKTGTNNKLKRVARQAVTCDSGAIYRSADGTCNNLDNPTWGSVGQTYRRLLDPAYDDGVNLPRMKKVNGEDLPSPRSISTRVHDFDRNRFHGQASVMLMEWGQFLAHDIVGTPVDDENLEGDCCYDALVTGSEKHPDVATGGPCLPIIISAGDRYFTNVSTRCMEFVRSQPVTDGNGVRQQKNMLSAFIDGTTVYGDSEEAMNDLRSFSGGKLKVKNDDFLPESSVNECIKSSDKDYCLQAGDSRVNVYPPLGAMHTIFMRYHNYVADQLAANHVDYDEDKLFQEARKIVIAAMQRITYNEYIRRILSSSALQTYGLTDEWAYDASCDATLSNAFVTAAFRFGHSMVPDSLLIDGVSYNSVDLYKRPFHVLTNLDSLLQGMVTQSAEKADRWYSEGITDQLFETEPQNGYDIAALNIQRGRDHGLPDYNKWRQFCGLSTITDFTQMSSSRRYQDAYGDVNDVDLYSGALSENGGTVGPTYQCLIGEQFQRLRNCDRFWWETTDASIGFANERARKQLGKIKLSHIICLTTGITQIQSNVFLVPQDRKNAVQTCEELLASSIDYSFL